MIRLALRVRREQAELVLAQLLELSPQGAEEVQVDEHTVEYAVYGAAGELPTLPRLRAAAGQALVEVTTTEIADDWSERWKRFHRPILIPAPRSAVAPPGAPAPGPPRAGASADRAGAIVPSLRVRPPWERAQGQRDGARVEEIVIDPGQAFGTGAHATTRLCLELMLELAASGPERGALLDVGTGSGVLAIAAARLGYGPLLALDHDSHSIAAARANAAANGVPMELRRVDLRAGVALADSVAGARRAAPVVLANLLLPLLLELARALEFSPSHLLAGGLMRDQVQQVADAFHDRHGLRERARREHGEWAAAWLSAD